MLNGVLWELPGRISLMVAALSCDPHRFVGVDDQSRADELSVVWTLVPVDIRTRSPSYLLDQVKPTC